MAHRKTTSRLWNLHGFKSALPLISRILLEIRKRYLEDCRSKLVLKRQRSADHLNYRAIRLLEENRNEAEVKLQEVVDELKRLKVFCIDPVNCEAIAAFWDAHCRPPWLVFSPFEGISWCFDDDLASIKRSIHELDEACD